MSKRKGWICPVCNHGVAPRLKRCPCVAIEAKRQVEAAPVASMTWPFGSPGAVPDFTGIFNRTIAGTLQGRVPTIDNGARAAKTAAGSSLTVEQLDRTKDLMERGLL